MTRVGRSSRVGKWVWVFTGMILGGGAIALFLRQRRQLPEPLAYPPAWVVTSPESATPRAAAHGNQSAQKAQERVSPPRARKELPEETGSDDLKVIAGIGPKIEEVLRAAGIRTYAQLADTSVEQLQAILSQAGPRFRLANPSTWPEQARLAANGDWEGLRSLQATLRGEGRPR